MTFDRMTRPEFAGLFVRTTKYVKTQSSSPQELNGRINSAKVELKKRAKEAERQGNKGLAKSYRYRAQQLGKLLKSDFSETAFTHAAWYPKGIVKLSLLFGQEKAKRIKLAAERTRLRSGKSGVVSRYSDLHRKF